jgi:hypothetical protein
VVVAVLDTGILPAHPDIAGSPNLVYVLWRKSLALSW